MAESQLDKQTAPKPRLETAAARCWEQRMTASHEADRIQFAQSMIRATGQTAAEEFGQAPEPYEQTEGRFDASCSFWEPGPVGASFDYSNDYHSWATR